MLGRLLREPLLHFLLLGGVLFVIYGRGGPEPPAGGTEIVVTAADIQRIAAGFSATWQRPPSENELQGAINDYIREEVLYRTGLSLGLDKDDTIVRRRIRQKMDFFLEDTVGKPDESELRTFFDANANKFRVEPRISFRQVFLSSKRSNPKADAEALLPQLVASGPNVVGGGDPLLLPETFGLTPLSQIDAQFGEGFASELSKVAPGHWAGPLKSAYGFHLVLVTAAQPSQFPPFEEVRNGVQREWFAARRAAVLDEEYQKLQANYHVRVEGLPARQ
jgi:parvulin-like peptidyl-prolyl cis-trans isomerase-like protein